MRSSHARIAEVLLWSALLMAGALWTYRTISSPPPPPPQWEGTPYPAAQAAQFASQLDLGAVRSSVERLSRFDSRVTGYGGNRLAGDWIASQLREAGATVETQRFLVPVPIIERAFLSSAFMESKTRLHSLFAVWPNLVRTSMLNFEDTDNDIIGELLYAGDGDLARFNGKQVKDKIVVLDFNCGTRWLSAAMLGAQAIVFVEPDETMRAEAEKKYLRVPIDAPRFYVKSELGEQLKTEDGCSVRLSCRMNWKNVEGRNLYALIEGTDPHLKNDCIALTGYYDSISAVPAIAPGAEQACGIATLVELARALKKNPPRRSVLLVATDAHHLALQGALHFFDTFGRERAEDREQRISELRQQVSTLTGELESAKSSPAPNKDQLLHELRAELTYARQDLALAERFRKFNLPLVIGLDLTTQNDTVGVFHMGSYFTDVDLTRFFSPIGQQFTTWLRETDGMGEREDGRPGAGDSMAPTPPLAPSPIRSFVDAINPTQDRNYTSWTPSKIAFDSEMVTRGGRPGITFATVNDARSRVNTPLDRFEHVNFTNLEPQVRRVAFLVAKTLNDPQTPEMLKRLRGLRYDLSEVEGRTLVFERRRTFVPSTPVPHSLVLVPGTAKSLMGVHTEAMAMARTDGYFRLKGQMYYASSELEAYHFDERTGAIDFAPDRGADGDVKFPRGVLGRVGLRRPLILFPCKTMTLFDLIDERYFETFERMFVYDATTHNEPVSYGFSPPVSESSAAGPTGGGESLSYVEPVATVFALPHSRIKITMGMGLLGVRMALINADDRHPEGRGFEVDRTPRILQTSLQGTADLHRLNTHRLADLRKHGVVTKRDLVVQLHERAGAALRRAHRHLDADHPRYDLGYAAVRAASGYETNAYPDVQSTVLDVVKGVLFYLALLLPFAYFSERLLFAFPEVKKQIPATVGLFLSVFFVLRYVHPAFELKVAPAIIFLAFIIIALAFMVTMIVVTKFNQQLTQMKQETAGVHEADVGRLSATAAAFNLGIANMRRRKARTALTCLTLVLLTFTVLSFTSVQTYLRKNELNLHRAPAYNGLMIRDKACGPIEEPTLASLRNEFAGSDESRVASDEKGHSDANRHTSLATRHSPLVVGRAWIASENYDKRGSYDLIAAAHPDRRYMVNGFIGLEAQEAQITGVAKTLAAGRWLEPSERFACLISESTAQQLGISAIDVTHHSPLTTQVRIFGTPFQVVGIYREKDFEAVRDLDNETLGPVDYLGLKDDVKQQLKEMRDKKLQLGRVDESALLADYSHFAAGNVAIIPFETAMDFGGSLRSIAIGGVGGESPFNRASDLVERFALSIYAGEKDSTRLYSAIGLSGFSGLKDIMFPLVIAAMIVLNTMLGAVYERTKEIGIFSSVGLAPVHIGTLFLAEACVYANIGAIAGYLLGQVIGKALSHHNLLALTLNYSSMSAVTVTMLVIATVLLSTIYPARKASQIAVPDVERKWKLPDPSGDEMVIRMPFMLTGGHARACPAFLLEYFDSYLDYTGGEFYTDGVNFHRLETPNGDGYALTLRMWLAPYDLGVSQVLDLKTTPTAEGHVYEIHLHVRRESGDINSWRKTNWLFLNAIRKQFLIWRTISPASKAEYERRADEMLRVTATA